MYDWRESFRFVRCVVGYRFRSETEWFSFQCPTEKGLRLLAEAMEGITWKSGMRWGKIQMIRCSCIDTDFLLYILDTFGSSVLPSSVIVCMLSGVLKDAVFWSQAEYAYDFFLVTSQWKSGMI